MAITFHSSSRYALGVMLTVHLGVGQALVPLTDELLSDVAGQDGVSMVIDGVRWSTRSLDYTQDGETLSLKGLSSRPVSGSSGLSTLRIDTLSDSLALSLTMPQTEYRIDDVVLGSGLQSLGSVRAFFNSNVNLGIKPGIQTKGGGLLAIDPLPDPGLVLSGALSLSKGTAYVRYDGYDLIAKGLRLGTHFTDVNVALPQTPQGNDIKLTFTNVAVSAALSGLTLDLAFADPVPGTLTTPSTPDLRHPNAARSLGSVSADLTASGSVSFTAGGAQDQGLRIKPDVTWNSGALEYKDVGVMRSSEFSGSLSSASGITVDLDKDTQGTYVQFAASDMSVTAQLGKLVVGDPATPKLGNVGINLLFSDTVTRRNEIRVRAGGDAHSGTQGLTAQMSWNLASGSASITDNNNSLWLSGLKSYGSGTLTLDLTRRCSTSAPVCYSGTLTDPTNGNYNGHFDGLRLGFSDISAAYSLEGIRVGSSTAPLQGGTELLLLAGVFPTYDAVLNGHATLLPGGKLGDGLRFNADLFLSKVTAALSTDEFGKGIWLTDAAHEMHYRNGSVDVSSAGIEVNKGESWTQLEANDFRLGSQATGTSIGRVALKTYELNSSLTLATGGSGALCVGAVAISSLGCTAAGGRWEDRGNEGLTVKLKSFFVRDGSADSVANGIVTDEKRNQLALEARRTVGADGKPVKGSGVQVVLDNFWTSDAQVGNATANNHGLNVELGVDVAPTVVISKMPPFTQTMPLGFAVNGRVSFKELGAQRLQAIHPVGGAQTLLYGARIQNADVRFNLTATPIN